MVLSRRGSFNKATSTLAGKALKAMNGLLLITKHLRITFDIMFNLFDTFVASILNYSCEILGGGVVLVCVCMWGGGGGEGGGAFKGENC